MLDQFRNRLDRHLWVHDQHVREPRDQAYRLKILLRIEREILVDERVDRMRAHGADEQRMTVARRARDRGGADVAACARPVVGDERAAVFLLQALGEHPANMSVVPPAVKGTTIVTWRWGQPC